jgi:MEDS: MEthanogen/methylotroph, DcmR Sensory domain
MTRMNRGIMSWRKRHRATTSSSFTRTKIFLNRAVCRFAGVALSNEEGIILVPTLPHWNAIRPRLEAEGVDVEAARKRGQLTVVDADELLPRFMKDAMPDSTVFLGLAGDAITKARGGGHYPKVRSGVIQPSS